MNTSRRLFLKHGGLALASVGLAPTLGPLFLRRTALAAEMPTASHRQKVLICLFQRGAVDGLSMVVPHGDPFYYQHRSAGPGGIALPNTGDGKVIDLDGFFGLHPTLAPLKPIYDAGHLAAIQAVGSPNATRSHFDAQDYMESAAPGDKGIRDGWLARALLHCPKDKIRRSKLFQAVSLTPQVPRSLQGDADALAIADLRTFGVNGETAGMGAAMAGGMGGSNGGAAGGFEALYDQAVGDVLHGAGKESFEAIKMLSGLHAESYVPAPGAEYPRGRFGDALQQIAQLVKADVGVQVAFAESGGWDTHAGQGGAQGQLARNLGEFGRGLAALFTDLGDRMGDVVILTMSEFGRTVRQNGTGGTDHGHATCFLALGGAVSGGKVLGRWPGLSPEHLNEDRDLALTTDFRDVFGEIAAHHLGVHDLAAVFPGHPITPKNFRGVLRA